MRVDVAIERVGKDFRQRAREDIRVHPFALDDAGIAVARLLARFPPVDQSDRQSTPPQMDRGGNANDARAKNRDVELLRHPRTLSPSAPSRRSGRGA